MTYASLEDMERAIDALIINDDMHTLLCMADLYAHKCTQQYEKFDYYRRNGVTWSWYDCEAAYQLCTEHFGGLYWSARKKAGVA